MIKVPTSPGKAFAGYLLKKKKPKIMKKNTIEYNKPSPEFRIILEIIKNPTAIKHVPEPSPL
jgi:hypothetical protein